MTQRIASTGPAPIKQLYVCNDLRSRIADGEYPPGERLPSVPTLARHYNVAVMTMQKALGRLKRDGLVRGVRRRGVFVSDHPPHRHRVAVAYPSAPGADDWNMLAGAVLAAAGHLTAATDLTLCPYFNVTRTGTGRDARRLLHDMQTRSLRGVFFLTHPQYLRGTALLGATPVPRVALMSRAIMPPIKAVETNWALFAERAVRHFLQLGCRRIGIVATNGDNDAQLAALRRAVAAAAVDSEAYWLQAVPWDAPTWARNTAHAMFVHRRRPNALVITDDHLVAPVLAGVRDAGRQVGGDVSIVAHCNFPNQPEHTTGVSYLGFDAAAILRAGVALMTDDHRELIAVPPVFEYEYAAVSAATTAEIVCA